MKKFKFLLLFAFITQINIAQEVDLGVKLGANFANYHDVRGFDNKTGFVGGAFLALRFNKISIQPELLYSQQGAEFKVDDFDLDYINMPIMLKYYITGGLNIQAGPQFGFVIEDNVRDSVTEGFKTESFDLSGAAGLGFDLPLNLRIEARYIFGFTDVFEKRDAKNEVYTISLGFTFL